MNTSKKLRNRLWDAREAANFLKVSRSWIYARVERDEMPYIRVGGLIRSSLPSSATGHSRRIASRADMASVYKKGGRWWVRFNGAGVGGTARPRRPGLSLRRASKRSN